MNNLLEKEENRIFKLNLPKKILPYKRNFIRNSRKIHLLKTNLLRCSKKNQPKKEENHEEDAQETELNINKEEFLIGLLDQNILPF